MAEIIVHLPVQDDSQSVEFVEVVKTEAAAGDEIIIKDALINKNNSLQIFAETSASSTIIIKQGNNYPNKILGEKTVPVEEFAVILLEDISRFENRDGSVVLKCGASFSGNVWATAKRVGMKPVDQE